MNEILLSVYGAVRPSAPYVIAAYVLIWIILFVFVAVIVVGMRKNQRDYEQLERVIRHLNEQNAHVERKN